jgi:ABC-type Mn2+/Zn2+ transport system ATPase subunit
MQNYVVDLQSEVSHSFRCQKAANSLDIDTEKKSKHHLAITADLKTPFNIGLIVGASGSGKTTLAKNIFGEDCFKTTIDSGKAIIDQFPTEMSYDDCAASLAGMGLTSVPCWIRPVYTLSNGQKARAEAALHMTDQSKSIICIDEWTSVVDRTVAKVMSHCIQKHARKTNRQVILNSCHYDVIEWLNPDFIIDCNKQEYIDRRSMVGAFKRGDQLQFGIKPVSRKTWPYFSKYHYLSERLPGGQIFTYGLFDGANQIGFQCFAAYIIGDHKTFFSNRTVIHPDYAGFGMGIKLITETSKDMVRRGYRIKAKFSSTPIYKSMKKDPYWKCTAIKMPIKKGVVGGKAAGGPSREAQLRSKTVTYHFDFIWKP